MHKSLQLNLFLLFTIFSFIATSQNTKATEGCTDVTVYYWGSSTWYASAWYTPCGHTTEYPFAWNVNYSGDSLSIASGSSFRIGVAGSTKTLLTVNPTGSSPYYITCGGSSNDNSTCWPGQMGKGGKSSEKQKPQGKKKPSSAPAK